MPSMVRVATIALLTFACGSSASPEAPSTSAPSGAASEPVAVTTLEVEEETEPVAEDALSRPPPAPAEPAIVVVADPGLEARYAEVTEPAPTVRLRKTRSARNAITDDERWLSEHDIGHDEARPEGAPAGIEGVPFAFATSPDDPVAIYGTPYEARYLWVVGHDGAPNVFDLRNLLGSDMEIADARRVGELVYLTRAHRTYASATDGANAYLVALDADTGEVRWVSEPLTSNVRAFTHRGRVLFTGYGFTSEPDHLYAVDRLTGRRLATLPLRKGPTFVVADGDTLHVRTYDRDVTVAVEVN